MAAVCAIAGAILMGSRPQVTHGQTSGRPNIVVVMIDDYDLGSLWTLIGTGKMPNLTRYFLQTGYLFSDSFSVAGLGGPSRATFLTGQYPHNHGVTWGFPPRDLTVLNETSTVATWLQAAGYRTGHVGRYVTGYGWWTSQTAVPAGWDDWKTLVDPSSNNTVQYKININGSVVDIGALVNQLGTELHQVDILSVLAADFVRKAPAYQQPFFLMVAPGVFNFATDPPYNVCPLGPPPHYDPLFGGNPWGAAQKPADRHMGTIYGDATRYPLPTTPSFNEEDVSDKPFWVRDTRYLSFDALACLQLRYWRKLEVMRSVDDLIGTLFAELESTGMLSNTVVMFTADNGFMDGQHRVAGKGLPFEEAIRIPLFIRPRGTAPLRIVNKLVLNTDFAPTIAALAEATPTHTVDGRSLIPLMQNPETAAWRKIGFLQFEGDLDPFAQRILPPSYIGVRTDRTRPRLYAYYPTLWTSPNGELYDLVQDPYELNNRYLDSSRQAERDRLDLWMNLLKTCKGTSCQFLENYFTFN
jgi:arylsulfatase A-like enzyme